MSNRAAIPGHADFAESIVHPQHWPDDLDHEGKRFGRIDDGHVTFGRVRR
jgi:hypothetical protein